MQTQGRGDRADGGRARSSGSPRGRNRPRRDGCRGGRGSPPRRDPEPAEKGSADSGNWRRRESPCPPQTAPARQETSNKIALVAVSVVGECESMCSTEEVCARQRMKDISRFERAPGETTDAAWAVKKYRRPAAGRVDVDAKELRPPRVLETTLHHLFTDVLPWAGCGFDWSIDAGADTTTTTTSPARQHDFLALYHFVSDRLRSVRQDFVIQRASAASRVAPLVRIARFYVLASFRATQLLDLTNKTFDWSETLNDQQLASALTEIHAQFQSMDRNRESGDGHSLLLHAEATAYDVILQLHDPRAVSLLLLRVPTALYKTSSVTRSLALFVAFQTHDFVGFKRTFRRLPVLQQCLALRHLPVVWVATIKMMNKSHGKIDRFTLAEIAESVDLPRAEDARRLCSAMGIHTEDEVAPVESVPPTSDSWEDSADHTELRRATGSDPSQSIAFARFKVNAMNDELREIDERELLRRKAASVLEAAIRAHTATSLVMSTTPDDVAYNA